MTKDSHEIDTRMQRFEQVLKEAGIKLTHQRLEIFREVAGAADHPDAETIFKRVRERIPTVSMDTVYRTLWMLSDLGLIITLGASRERARFDANLKQHHHFVCESCGLTRDFFADDFNALKLPESVAAIGQVTTTHIEARGICLDCALKKHTPKKK